MSDGITDAIKDVQLKPESKRLNPFVQTSAPIRCDQCIFITGSPPNDQWKCINPLQEESCFDVGICKFHLTLDELAAYFRQRLLSKLTNKQ